MEVKSGDTRHSRNFLLKQHWTPLELAEHWSLSADDCVMAKQHKPHALAYALQLRYFDHHGFFPYRVSAIPEVIIQHMAQCLSVSPKQIMAYPEATKTRRRHRAQIRAYYGYRKVTSEDLTVLRAWLHKDVLPQGLSKDEVHRAVMAYMRRSRWEPHYDVVGWIDRVCAEFDHSFFQHYGPLCQPEPLEALLQLYDETQTLLNFVRKPAGKLSAATIDEEMLKLGYLKDILYSDTLNPTTRLMLKKYHDRVEITTPYVLSQMSPDKRYTLLACFGRYKGAHILDNFITIFIRKLHKLQKKAQVKAKEALWQEEENHKTLYQIVDISLAHPEGIIKDKIYEGVGGRAVLEQLKQSKKTKQQRRAELEYEHLSVLYRASLNSKPLLAMLQSVRFRTHTHAPLLAALQAVLNDETPVIKGLFSPLEHKITQDKPLYRTLVILKRVRKALKCKNIWVEGAWRYSDPHHDLPQDFAQKKEMYCQALTMSADSEQVVAKLKHAMQQQLSVLNAHMPHNAEVRIRTKAGKPHIYVTPAVSQDEPQNIKQLKQEIGLLWPNTSLLDVLKEADLRIGLTSELIAMTDQTRCDPDILQQRLLLCLFALGTNTELKKVCGGTPGLDETDLAYVKKRFITPASLRAIIRKLVNATLEIRDPDLWGTTRNSFASDSTKFAVWSNNLMSEYHVRYRGDGIMAYWHVDQKSLCIFSQVQTCSSSEVASMLAGVIHHATKAHVRYHSTDTHGQSLVAFAFAHLLGIDLRPRIKGMGHLKLSPVDAHMPHTSYNHLKTVMAKPIRWQRIHDHYDALLQYVVALKLKTAEPAVLLKRFITENTQNPVYQACLELGRAVRTLYLSHCLHSREMRIEVHEVLNVVEAWNKGNHTIFFGKRGVVSTNDPADQEIAILSLHLIQSALVYVNTLMVQQVLKTEAWKERLTKEDKRALTALFYHHMTTYGVYYLDMTRRLNIEDTQP